VHKCMRMSGRLGLPQSHTVRPKRSSSISTLGIGSFIEEVFMGIGSFIEEVFMYLL
jgi:hypothetical protein